MRHVTWGFFGLALTACAGDEQCHQQQHVGAFAGDLDGEIVLDAERVNDDNLLHLELSSADDAFFASGTAVVDEAREGGCSDWSFEGEITDDLGAVGTLEGVLTTTTGEGTWTFEDGRSGTWSWGVR